MASTNIIKISDYKFNTAEPIILDTNILIYLFYPCINERIPKDYQDFYSFIVEKGNLVITSIQLSEFINRCIRFQFNLYKEEHPDEDLDYKRDYRGEEDYNESMKAIIETINNDIVPKFKFIDDGFSLVNPDDIFSVGFSFDFNDSLLCEIARRNNAAVVTHDRDFANYASSGITILTVNPKLLMFARSRI